MSSTLSAEMSLVLFISVTPARSVSIHSLISVIKVSESRDDSGWFNEIGELTPPDWAIDEFEIDTEKSPLPDECVRACSHSGRVDDDVSAWVDELKFD